MGSHSWVSEKKGFRCEQTAKAYATLTRSFCYVTFWSRIVNALNRCGPNEEQGHLWGWVQVIKPPTLIEIHGPMFMSYAAVGHVQFRLEESEPGCQLSLRHRILGMVPEDHREGLTHGWNRFLEDVKRLSK